MPDTVRLSLDQMLERFKFLGKQLAPTVYRAMLVSGQEMLRRTVKDHMSGPRRGSKPSVLGRDHGTARRSMIAQTEFKNEVIGSLVGSPLGYVRAHEEGFDGSVQVRGHTRRIIRLERNTKTGRVSKKSAAAYKAASRRAGKTLAFVRPYKRDVRMPALHFIRDAVLESVTPTENRIVKALMYAARTGQVPTPGQLGG